MDNDIQEAKKWMNDLYRSAIRNQYSNPMRYNELVRKARLLNKLVKHMEKEVKQ